MRTHTYTHFCAFLWPSQVSAHVESAHVIAVTSSNWTSVLRTEKRSIKFYLLIYEKNQQLRKNNNNNNSNNPSKYKRKQSCLLLKACLWKRFDRLYLWIFFFSLQKHRLTTEKRKRNLPFWSTRLFSTFPLFNSLFSLLHFFILSETCVWCSGVLLLLITCFLHNEHTQTRTFKYIQTHIKLNNQK